MDATTLELDAVKFAQLAVQRDQSGRYQEAVFYYKVRRGRAGSLGAPVSPSARRELRDAFELPEGSRSPFGPPGAGEEGSAPPRPGPARPCRRRETRWVSAAAPALPRRVCLGNELLGLGKTRRCPPRRERKAVRERRKFVGLRRSRVLQAGCETPFPCPIFRWERALPVR